MKNEIQIFNFNQNQVRTILKDGEPWFVAKDIADALEYRNAPDAIRTLDDDERDTHIVRTSSGNQEMTIINESGLYSLVLKSRKPEAKIFKRWVTGEVLPAIRKTGGYGMPAPIAVVDMKAIGGMVKKCVGVAVRDEISKMFGTTPEVDSNDVLRTSYYNISDKTMLDYFQRWYGTKNYDHVQAITRLNTENDELKSKLRVIQKAVA